MSSATRGLIVNPTLRVSLKVEARRRGEPYRPIAFDVSAQPALAALCVDAARAEAGSPDARLLDHAALLRQLNLLVAEAEATTDVPAELALDPELLAFLPRAREEAGGRSLAFDAECVRLQLGHARPETTPPGMPPAETFPTGGGLVWVFDRATRMWAAYRADAGVLRVLRRLERGKIRVTALAPELRELFVAARILSSPRQARVARGLWRALGGVAARGFRASGIAIIRDVLPPLWVAGLRRYLRALEREGYLTADRSTKRLGRAQDPLTTFLHRQTGALVRRITSSMVLPSFVAAAAYLPSASLARHTDRDQCRWNMSLLVDWVPEGPLEGSWPLYIETPRGTKKVQLGLGDAVVYSGRDQPHYRRALSRDERQTVLLLCYVPVEFTGDR